MSDDQQQPTEETTQQPVEQTPPPAGAPTLSAKAGADKKLLCGILAVSGFFWGGFGAHKFVMGYTKEGVIQLILTLCCGIGTIIGIIEGIIYLTKSDEEFVDMYITNKKPWF